MQLTIDTSLRPRLLEFVTDSEAVEDLASYYQEGPPGTGYSGRWFERIGTPEDQERDRNRLTADDIVAVSALGIRLPITVSSRLLGEDAAEISELLAEIPADVDLWDASRSDLGPRSAAGRLFQRFRAMAWNGGEHGTSGVTASKLLARKRPLLIPIYDRQVRTLVGLSNGANWWVSLNAALTQELREHLEVLHQEAGLEPIITPLRTLDVVLWMRARRHAAAARAS
ncbi:hypothetical protein EV644_12284 [Kribbella orskensis]|uniref:Uncharacterized protein n=1 Tax=Kribbella orskensis TaxID=2512216 RepID=A0ABY2BCL6_9ACTN|nr:MULTISPECIES: DUF6308 family protein [Kribbella]TCN33463.1 hypothetical protein EV642_12484 [Kribbella sp. VKM Ac-2500]TCO13609.1 hypothetical protein EV644_12284 [Kribbella orskensis]